MAETGGLEPPPPFGGLRFSKPMPCHSATFPCAIMPYEPAPPTRRQTRGCAVFRLQRLQGEGLTILRMSVNWLLCQFGNISPKRGNTLTICQTTSVPCASPVLPGPGWPASLGYAPGTLGGSSARHVRWVVKVRGASRTRRFCPPFCLGGPESLRQPGRTRWALR